MSDALGDRQAARVFYTWSAQASALPLEIVDGAGARFTTADGVAPGEYGRREAFQVHQALKRKGPVTVPREFVFMDRAAIGLGGVFLYLQAELNFHRLFNEAIESFSLARVAERQAKALAAAGLPPAE